MKIFITGGAGCLGTNLIEHLLPQGHEITILDNFATGKKVVVEGIKGINLIEGSVYNKDLIFSEIKNCQPDIIIHSAAAYKNPQDWEEDTKTNVLGSIYTAQAALENGVKRLINFQTALCYGRPHQLPIPNTHPTQPFTSYGISKTAGEAFIMNSGLNAVSLRLANICAPRLAIGPIPTFYTRLKDGKSCFCSDTERDFLDISDFFSLIDIVLKNEVKSGTYNVSTGQGYKILRTW
jgi:UDP-glucose 4-epimerase